MERASVLLLLNFENMPFIPISGALFYVAHKTGTRISDAFYRARNHLVFLVTDGTQSKGIEWRVSAHGAHIAGILCASPCA